MMKNKKMGILAVLVMLVAVTLNAVGGTYAKYISSYGITDEARVAKWNFNDTATNTIDLFQQSYTKEKTGDEDGSYVYVASSDAWKVIAPGTSGAYEYQVSGTAETNFKVSQTLKIVNNVKLANGYDPLRFSTDGGVTWVSSDKIANIDNETVYPANANIIVSGKIEWKWEFETGNDTFDTELGKKAVEEELTVMVTIGTTVVQTQDEPTAVQNVAGDYLAAVDYVSVTNRLSDEDITTLAGIGYKAENASTTFNGAVLKGKVKAYEATDKLVEWFNVNSLDTNYFVVLKVTVPAGTKLYNTTAYEGNKLIKDNTLGAKSAEVLMPLNVRDLTGAMKYSLVDTNGLEKEYSIQYQLEAMNA